MRSRFIVLAQPNVKVCLQLVERVVHLLAERHSIELVERSLVEAFADAVGLRALSLGARMIDVLDREIELVLVPFGIAAELAAAVGEHAQQRSASARALPTSNTPSLRALTNREYEVLALLASGHPMKRIAYRLGITYRAVTIHKYRVMERLGITSNDGITS